MLKKLTMPSSQLSYFNILWCRWRTCWESKCLTRGELFACSWKSTQKNTAGIAFSVIVNVTLASISNISALIHPASYKTNNSDGFRTNILWGGKKAFVIQEISVTSVILSLSVSWENLWDQRSPSIMHMFHTSSLSLSCCHFQTALRVASACPAQNQTEVTTVYQLGTLLPTDCSLQWQDLHPLQS